VRLRLGELVLDPDRRLVLRGNEELHLQPKAYELLELLVRSRPRALSKLKIRGHLWPHTAVSDASLTVLVGELRSALGDDSKRPRYVRTVFGFGYALAAEVVEEGAVVAPAVVSAGGAVARVLWEKRVIPLVAGDNILGRDEGATIRIDAPGVSRQHACILLVGDEATIADLGSKNGTYVGDADSPIAGPVPLEDGARFRLGRVLLVFRSSAEAGATRTETRPPAKTSGKRP
jgi:DNA-binding winged helix-turn-helix (wHTH) protein